MAGQVRALQRGMVAAIAVALVVGACGSSTTLVPTQEPTPTAVVTPAPTPTPTPTPTLTPSPAPTPLPDPSEGLAIASPYTLEALDPTIGELLLSTMRLAMGSMADIVEVGARTVEKDGQTAAWVVVMRMPGVPVSSASFLDSVAGGMAGTTSGTITKKTILGTRVRIVSAPSGTAVVFVTGDRIVVIVNASRSVEIAIATAIIKANG